MLPAGYNTVTKAQAVHARCSCSCPAGSPVFHQCQMTPVVIHVPVTAVVIKLTLQYVIYYGHLVHPFEST